MVAGPIACLLARRSVSKLFPAHDRDIASAPAGQDPQADDEPMEDSFGDDGGGGEQEFHEEGDDQTMLPVREASGTGEGVNPTVCEFFLEFIQKEAVSSRFATKMIKFMKNHNPDDVSSLPQ